MSAVISAVDITCFTNTGVKAELSKQAFSWWVNDIFKSHNLHSSGQSGQLRFVRT